MDKKSIVGFVMITLVFIGWMTYSSVNRRPEPLKVQENKTALTEKKKQAKLEEEFAADSSSAKIVNSDSAKAVSQFGQTFAKFATPGERFITIETDLYKVQISSKGAAVKKWFLKNYKKWNNIPTQLVPDQRGELGILLTSRDSQADTVDTRNLRFTFDNLDKSTYKLSGNDSLTITARLQIDEKSAIVRKITFYNGKYHVDMNVTMQNMENYLRQKRYDLAWTKGLTYQEAYSSMESEAAHAMIVSNGELSELNASSDTEPITSDGTVDFAAIKTKYFATAIIPQPFRGSQVTVSLSGKHFDLKDKGSIERYNLTMRIPYDGGIQSNSFRVFVGPIDYTVCEEYGLEELVDFGWRIFRPIGEYLLLPFLKFLFNLIGSYGFAIIIFSIVIKFLLYPLSIKQMRSVAKMRLINPILAEVREKYKDDQQAQQQATMKIYGEYGINPAGGCLPLLFQMPILYALYAVMNNAIDLRQSDFILWITDLSQPDIIIQFPFSLLGLTHISGLALMMGVTMFLQQKMTITDPKQKSLMYMMPIMFTLMFAYLPAGLNLYYFIFNLLSIGQQVYIEKFSKKKYTLEDLKKAPKKEGWMQRKMREAQEMAVQQGKIPPGMSLEELRQKQQELRKKQKQNKKKK